MVESSLQSTSVLSSGASRMFSFVKSDWQRRKTNSMCSVLFEVRVDIPFVRYEKATQKQGRFLT